MIPRSGRSRAWFIDEFNQPQGPADFLHDHSLSAWSPVKEVRHLFDYYAYQKSDRMNEFRRELREALGRGEFADA